MKYLMDLASSQPQVGVKTNGGGGYALFILKEIVNRIQSDDEMCVIFNSSLEDNDIVIQYCKDCAIKIYYYDSIHAFNDVIGSAQFDCIILPVCYYKYCDLRIKDSIRLITVIHDLCDVHYTEKNVKYGRYIGEDGLDWVRKLKGQIVGKVNKKKYIEAHNRVMHLNNNQTIITVSHYSANAFHKYLNIRTSDSIKVFYTPEVHSHIILNDLYKEQSVLDKYNLCTDRYFMLSAGARWTKNNAIALFVLDELFANSKYNDWLDGFKVIILGTDQVHKRYYEKHINNLERFIIDDYVDDYTIETLYKHTHLFLFPSVLEGFGLPPIEAMKYGSISACSDEMSIPEICGNAVIYFDPYDKISIEKAILKSFDVQYTTELRKKGQRRYEYLEKRRDKDLESLIELILGKID